MQLNVILDSKVCHTEILTVKEGSLQKKKKKKEKICYVAIISLSKYVAYLTLPNVEYQSEGV